MLFCCIIAFSLVLLTLYIFEKSFVECMCEASTVLKVAVFFFYFILFYIIFGQKT